MTTPRQQLAEPPDYTSPIARELRDTFRTLDALGPGWIFALSASLSAPPAGVLQGHAYILPLTATGVWEGHGRHVAIMTPDGWLFRPPQPGWIAIVWDENAPFGKVYEYTGVEWVVWQLPAGSIGYDATGTDFISTDLESLMIEINTRMLSDEATLGDHETRIGALELGGGGGGSGGNEDPDTHPTSATAFDEEFEAALNFSTKWSWFNQNSATATVDKGSVVIEVPNATTDNPAAIVQAAPSTPFKIRAKVYNHNIGGDNRAGLLLLEQSSGKCYAFGTYRDSGGPLRFYANRSAPPASATGVFTGSNGEPGDPSTWWGANWWYLEIEHDGSNLIFRASRTGHDGTFRQLATQAATAYFSGAPSHVGLYHDRTTAAAGGMAIAQWIRAGF